jgi:hypothetical protein
MKRFKQYLTESHKTYDFKIKIAGECPDEATSKIKESLAQYGVNTCEQITRTPIQETHSDFPELKNVEVTIFEVKLDYPVTSEQIRNYVADTLGKSQSCIRVRNPEEENELLINNAFNELSGESLLLQDYDKKENFQSLVGEKQKMNLLKELGKEKHSGTQYKGVNDKILAKKSPSEKIDKPEKTTSPKSPLGSAQVKVPTAKDIK